MVLTAPPESIDCGEYITMHLRPIKGLPKPHEVPLAVVRVEPPRVYVELDDEQEHRVCLIFGTYQAARVTTADCFDLPPEIQVFPKEIVEIIDSPWIAELKAVLERTDHTATFMERARHFLIPAQDEFIEVVAWDLSCEALPAPSQ